MDASYDSHSATQKHHSNLLSDFLMSALTSCSQQTSVRIGDFGVATGLNSCKTFQSVLRRFRESSSAPVQLYHTDRPNNHWSALFTTLCSEESTQTIPDVYSFAVGKSFYSQLFPQDFLDIAYASTAFYWLSHPFTTTLHGFPSSYDASLAERHREDLTQLLKCRLSELKPGGHLIFNLPDSSTAQRIIFQPAFEVVQEMQQAGQLPEDYLDHFPVPFAVSSLEGNLSIIRSLGLEVLQSTATSEELLLYQQFLKTGDVDCYARSFSGFLKGFLYPFLKGTCTDDGEEKLQLFFQKLEDNIRNRPEPIFIIQSYFHLRKPLSS